MSAPKEEVRLPFNCRDSRLRGKWVVILDERVVDSDDNLGSCLLRVRSQHPGQEPLVLKVALPSRSTHRAPPRR